MRMWMIDPSEMCRKHLLGEHVELHMLVGTILKNKSLQGYKDNNLIEVHNIKKRHEELVKEIKKRGYNHKSPLPKFKSFVFGWVDRNRNKIEIRKRCPECKKLQLRK